MRAKVDARSERFNEEAICNTSRGANENAGWWALGNGLVPTSLVSYFVQSLGAETAAVSWIIAAPKLVGGLRYLAPQMLRLGGGYRGTSIACYLASTLLLMLLPLCSVASIWPSSTWAIGTIVIIWCVYHLLEYFGYVIFLSWVFQSVPKSMRGSFFGSRERWLTAGRMIGSLFAAGLSSALWNLSEADMRWLSYPILASYGALAMGLSVLPLLKIPEPEESNAPPLELWRDLAAWSSPRAYWLLIYGTWFSAANGLFSSLLYVYPYRALGLSLLLPLLMPVAMRLGQSAISKPIGKCIDRFGWRSTILFGQLLVSFGPWLFSFGIWGYAFGYIAWIAYALINVSLPIAIVEGKEGRTAGPPLAIYFGWTGIVFGVTTLLGTSIAVWMVPLDSRSNPEAYDNYLLVATIVRLTSMIPLLLLPKTTQAE